jgi:hypothetical protein
MKAEVATLEIGTFSLAGLLAENGELGIGVPQLAAIEVMPRRRSIKQLEALTGLTFQSHRQWVTPLHTKAVNVLSIEEFLQVVRTLALSVRFTAQSGTYRSGSFFHLYKLVTA